MQHVSMCHGTSSRLMTAGFVYSFIYVLGRSGKQFEIDWTKQGRETHRKVQPEILKESEKALHTHTHTQRYIMHELV